MADGHGGILVSVRVLGHQSIISGHPTIRRPHHLANLPCGPHATTSSIQLDCLFVFKLSDPATSIASAHATEFLFTGVKRPVAKLALTKTVSKRE